MTKVYKNGRNGLLGHKYSDETKKRISKRQQGNKNSFYGKKHTLESIEKIRKSAKRKRIRGIKHRPHHSHTGINLGDKNPNWKGGISSINVKIRQTQKYKLWRKSIFERDNYTCQNCGIKNCYIIVHHIKCFADYPELRFIIDNGITLCKECHKKTNNYGRPK